MQRQAAHSNTYAINHNERLLQVIGRNDREHAPGKLLCLVLIQIATAIDNDAGCNQRHCCQQAGVVKIGGDDDAAVIQSCGQNVFVSCRSEASKAGMNSLMSLCDKPTRQTR